MGGGGRLLFDLCCLVLLGDGWIGSRLNIYIL